MAWCVSFDCNNNNSNSSSSSSSSSSKNISFSVFRSRLFKGAGGCVDCVQCIFFRQLFRRRNAVFQSSRANIGPVLDQYCRNIVPILAPISRATWEYILSEWIGVFRLIVIIIIAIVVVVVVVKTFLFPFSGRGCSGARVDASTVFSAFFPSTVSSEECSVSIVEPAAK